MLTSEQAADRGEVREVGVGSLGGRLEERGRVEALSAGKRARVARQRQYMCRGRSQGAARGRPPPGGRSWTVETAVRSGSPRTLATSGAMLRAALSRATRVSAPRLTRSMGAMAGPGEDVTNIGLQRIEHDPRFLKVCAGLVGLAMLQRALPERKESSETHAHDAHAPAHARAADKDSHVAAAAAPSPTAAATAAAAEPFAPIRASGASGDTPCGVTGEWHVYSRAGVLYALDAAGDGEPLRLSPPGVALGSVVLGRGEVLVELDGFAPGAPALYRITLPASGEGSAGVPGCPPVAPAPDTASPAAPGSTTISWLTEEVVAPGGRGPPRLAVLGALTYGEEAGYALLLRSPQRARVGSPEWLATCRRLNLPEPPLDPAAPLTFSEFKLVDSWGAAQRKAVVGLQDGSAWIHDADSGRVVAYAATGEVVGEVPLR